MDEPALRRYIHTLSTRLLPKLSELSGTEERIAFVCAQAESQEPLEMPDFQQKDSTLSKRNRDDGNTAFQAYNYELAVLLYSEALRYSSPPMDAGGSRSSCSSPGGDSSSEDLFSSAAANRSAALFQLQRYEPCLQDIEMALEAGYPSATVYKLYIRQCKCLLQLGRISDAQASFDKAVDAIDRSGLNKGLRKNLAASLQEAFITLVKSAEENGDAFPSTSSLPEPAMPSWTAIADPHPRYPSASSAVAIRHDEALFGRHVVVTRDVSAGEVLFHERPIISLLMQEEDSTTEACHHCFAFVGGSGGGGGRDLCPIVPCPTCSSVIFCSLACRRAALGSYHNYECRLGPILRETKLDRLPLVIMSLRAVAQKPASFFLKNRSKFDRHNVRNGADEEDEDRVFLSDDYENLFHLVTHTDRREPFDLATKTVFATFLLRCLKAVHYFDRDHSVEDEVFVGKIILHFLESFQFNTHMVECVYTNRLIAQDAETRIWKDAAKFFPGEFVETVRLGGAVYPTLANVNHSCDPNIILLNWGNKAVVFANRPIKAGEQIFDTYGAVYYHINVEERLSTLQASHWFSCSCVACKNDWPVFAKLPREYLKLPGTHFKYKRCNRKELQKDVEKLKKQIRQNVLDEKLEESRALYTNWMVLLNELLYPPHQDYVNIRRGMRNCFWLQSPNVCRVREDEALKEKKANYKEKI